MNLEDITASILSKPLIPKEILEAAVNAEPEDVDATTEEKEPTKDPNSFLGTV